MATGRIIRTSFPDAYDRTILKMWQQGYGEPEHEYEKYYLNESIDTTYTSGSYISGFGTWVQKGLGQSVSFDSIYQGYDWTITPATYTSGFTLEEETAEDEKHGLLGGQLAANLGQMARYSAEILAVSQFNNGFTATTASPWMSGGDGQYFFDTDHPILSGGTYANRPTTDVDLSIAALQAARLSFRKMQDARGNLTPMTMKTVVVPPDSEMLAGELLNSTNIPYLADNTSNEVRKGLTYEVWDYLNLGSGVWLAHAGKAPNPGGNGFSTLAVWRLKPEFGRNNDFPTGDRQYKGRMRLGFGRHDWRGWYGSTGA